jgi:hypothetical protein
MLFIYLLQAIGKAVQLIEITETLTLLKWKVRLLLCTSTIMPSDVPGGPHQSLEEADTLPLDLQNCELNKPLFFTNHPASAVLL